MRTVDLRTAARATAAVVAGVRDDQLTSPTPCPDWTVGDLLDHIGGLSLAFALCARKQLPPEGAEPTADGSRLEPGWRERIVAALEDLGEAWQLPGAFDGITMAGPVEMPAAEAALVALDEVVVHGWDLARATGQPYESDPTSVATTRQFVTAFEAPVDDGGIFGPPVPVPDDAPELDRLIGATGRRPDWTP